MQDQAIKFVVFDWYWTAERVRNEHALAAYFQAKNNELIQFSILWANHKQLPRRKTISYRWFATGPAITSGTNSISALMIVLWYIYLAPPTWIRKPSFLDQLQVN